MTTIMTTPPPKTRLRVHRDDIQGIRGVAVLMVVLHHIGAVIFGGVDISFVLSGYLATDGLLRQSDKAGQVTLREYRTIIAKYYARRARRVLPLAAVVIVVSMIAAKLWVPAFKLKSISLDGLFAAVSGINYRLSAGATDYFADTGDTSPFQHYWSLSVEEQFYIGYALLFVAVLWIGQKLGFPRLTLGVVLGAVGVASLYCSIVVTKTSQPTAYFSFHTRAWELMIGILVALAARQFARMWQPLAALMSWAGLAVIAVGSVVVSHSAAIPGSVMLWPTVGAGLFIAGGCANPWFGAELLLGKPETSGYYWAKVTAFLSFIPKTLQYLGKVSYGWYLWHWPVLIIAPYALGRPLATWEKVASLAVTLAMAMFTNKFIESPIKATRALSEIPRLGLAFSARFGVAAVVAAIALMASTVAQAHPQTVIGVAQADQIEKLVEQATVTTRLPSEAASQLASIKSDLYPGCIVDVPEKIAQVCNLGDPNGSSQMVLMGSSLAWQWIPTLDRVAKDTHAKLAVLTKAGCPVEEYDIQALDTSSKGVSYSECAPWRADARNKIARLHPQVVIVSSRAETRITPEVVREAVTWFEGLGAKLVYLRETPHMRADVPNCLATHTENLQGCGVVLPARPESAMAIHVAREAGATVIDPTPWLCFNNKCPAVIDGKVVYWDDHHLSATYSQWLSGLFAHELSVT